MFDFSDPGTFWLNAVNLGVGLATLVCFAAIGYSVVKEALERYRIRKEIEADDHSYLVTDLGLTMADGGERIKKPSERVPKKAVGDEPTLEQKRYQKN